MGVKKACASTAHVASNGCITKGMKQREQESLSKRQAHKLEKAEAAAANAHAHVLWTKANVENARHRSNDLRDHVAKLDERLRQHGLTKQRDAKKEEVSDAKGELDRCMRDLDEAKATLKVALRKKDDVIHGLRQELEKRKTRRASKPEPARSARKSNTGRKSKA